MSWPRLLLLPLLAGLTFLLAGALTRQPTPAPIFPVKADPAARKTLEDALVALAPERVRWIRTELWQQASAGPLTFQTRGLYLAGPDNRLRLDLQVQQDTARSRLLTVSDGRTLWRAQQVTGQPLTVTRLNLARVLSVLHRPGAAAEPQLDFYRNHFFLGLTPLLRDLRDTMTLVRQERVRWRNRDVLLLSGVWSSPPEEWPQSFPRQCRLFLDARTLWPHRLEWWGPMPQHAGESLLLQMEFRNPLVGQPLPETEFTYNPGTSKVTDLTAQWAQP